MSCFHLSLVNSAPKRKPRKSEMQCVVVEEHNLVFNICLHLTHFSFSTVLQKAMMLGGRLSVGEKQYRTKRLGLTCCDNSPLNTKAQKEGSKQYWTLRRKHHTPDGSRLFVAGSFTSIEIPGIKTQSRFISWLIYPSDSQAHLNIISI